MSKTSEYELLYWPGIPGRGEFIRLLFEATSTPFTNTTSVPTVQSALSDSPVLALPLLRTSHLPITLSQTANILLFLGPRLGLAPADEAGRLQCNQLALTALDFSDEAHNTHHPVSAALYYDDQKEEAKRSAEQFRDGRIGKFTGFLERVLKEGGTGWCVGAELSYADLVWWQVIDGVKFAFPKAMERTLKENKLVQEHYERVKALDNVKAYLESGRRLKFGDGMFRYYEELDL